jgi:endo-1,4-beta-mannosidase
MAWELINEGNARPEALRLAWTAEMSAYVKSIDPNHLVSSGHANVTEKLSDLTIRLSISGRGTATRSTTSSPSRNSTT